MRDTRRDERAATFIRVCNISRMAASSDLHAVRRDEDVMRRDALRVAPNVEDHSGNREILKGGGCLEEVEGLRVCV